MSDIEMTRLNFARMVAHSMMKRLLDQFPMPTSLEFENIGIQDKYFVTEEQNVIGYDSEPTGKKETAYFNPYGEEMKAYVSGLKNWMVKEGFVHYESYRYVLTSKGLNAMGHSFLSGEDA